MSGNKRSKRAAENGNNSSKNITDQNKEKIEKEENKEKTYNKNIKDNKVKTENKEKADNKDNKETKENTPAVSKSTVQLVQPDIPTEEKKSKKKIVIPVCIAGAAAILAVGGYLVYYNSPDQVMLRSQNKAAIYAEEKDYSAAAVELERILELDDKNVQAYADLSEAYIEQDMTDKAVEVLQKGYELTNDGGLKTKLEGMLKEQALEHGNKFLSEKDYKQAAEEFQKVLDIDSKCVEAYIGKAGAFEGMNDPDSAMECLQQGIDETGNEDLQTKFNEIKIKTLLENAEKLYSQKEYDDARREYKNVLVIDAENITAYLGMADCFLAMDSDDSAVEILTAGFEQTKDQGIEGKLNEIKVSVYLKAADKFVEEEEYESAQRELKKAIDIDSKCVKAYLTYAEICGITEQIDEAVELLQKGFDNTSDEDIKTKLDEYTITQCLDNAEEYLDGEEYEKAKAEYEKVLELDEKRAEAYLGLADYYGRVGDQEEAKNILQMGLDITNDQDIAYRLERIHISEMLWQASSYYNNGNYTAAAEEYNNVIELDSYSVDAYLGAANSYVKLGRDSDAINLLQTGYNYTGNGSIWSRLVYLKKTPHLNLANSYLANGKYSEAAEEYRIVLDIDYYCTEAYSGLADAYAGMGNYSRAEQTLTDGYYATGNKEFLDRALRYKLNSASLSPQQSSYAPLNSLVQQVLSQITSSNMSTYQKVMACYDYLVNNCKYGDAPSSYYNAGDEANEKLYAEKSAYAILHGKVGICINYSAAFVALTRAIGLKSYLRTGQTTAYAGGYTAHVWCEIELGGTMYIFDPQLDDEMMTRGDIYEYTRFCTTYDKMSYHYIPEGYHYMY
ncbi:MAG: tetratricopeptide repeat protein [Ruminococcaceae bacterium]|nr:tetratricopeptide repeat protein [Oscillospiraceae bacterium]